MKITIESTSKVVTLKAGGLDSVLARIWEGQTESGVPVYCLITRMAPTIDPQDPANAEKFTQFERELKEQRIPSAEIEAIPLRLIL